MGVLTKVSNDCITTNTPASPWFDSSESLDQIVPDAMLKGAARITWRAGHTFHGEFELVKHLGGQYQAFSIVDIGVVRHLLPARPVLTAWTPA